MPPEAEPSIVSISDVTGTEERSFREKIFASQPFWVTVALLVLSLAIGI